MASATGSDSLAEWSQKIKNLQQEVNEDGRQEQARLEAEIAKSRMERANRRSTLTGNARIDQATASYLSRLPDHSPEQEPRIDALQRLQGGSEPSKPTVEEARSSTPTSYGGTAQASSKGMSLAEFMGGRATGPRLNKHAPQAAYQEHASDYEARNRSGATSMLQQVSNPAPVALHGLASKDSPRKVSPTPGRSQTDLSGSPFGNTAPKSTVQSFKISSPPSQSRSPAARASFDGKTTSSTSGSSFSNGDKPVFRRDTSPASPPIAHAVKASGSPSPVTSPQPSTPTSSSWNPPTSPALPKSPTASSPSPSIASPRVEMLARPVQPSPSPVQRFIPATNPSPAFLKPGPPKEERPSITRLQGRGFVEKQVKASARLSSTPEEAGKAQRPTATEKKLSVLERWPGGGGNKPTSPTPVASSDVPKREFHRSLPSGGVASAGPMKVAAFVAATNNKNPPRTRNPEQDSTPLRLPGMGPAGPASFKSRSQPESAKESVVSTEASLGPEPRRLPGLAADVTTPSALKKSSSSTDLRTPSKRRSVHFDDLQDEENSTTKAVAFNGNQTDTANSKKLVHMTKDRARKPRKAGAKSGLSVETRPTDVEETPVEPPGQHEKRVSESTEEAKKASPEASIPMKVPPVPIPPTVESTPPSKARPANDAEIPPPTPTVDIPVPVTPATPVSARPSSREGRPKLPPPIVAPKPAALRRNSLPTPTEKNDPSFPRQYQPGPQAEKSPASVPSGAQGTLTTVTPSSPTPNEDAAPSISVRAAASSWGKLVSSQAPESEKVSISREIEALKQAVGSPDPSPSSAPEPSEPPIVVPAVLNPPVVPMPQPRPRPLSQSSERRRSISNRYSAIILPPLKEEKTPVATPEGSLRINTERTGPNIPSAQALHDSLVSASVIQVPSHKPERSQSLEVIEPTPPKANGHSPMSPLDRTVVIAHEDTPIPAFNLSRLLASLPATPKLAPGAAISVETFVISGSASTAVKENMHVFYDAEVVAIVYRGKNKSTGLVSTTVWAWIGSKATLGDRETAKLQDMANRFNTTLLQILQGKEPYDVVQLLGGTMAIRHGPRLHWSPDNTALHCVRMHSSHFVVIEENELMSRNICSAFSYCLAILDALFVWHGRGALPTERAAARAYAKAIASEGVEPTELEEGEDDDMFWMMLDEGGYANADYWRFRSQLPPHMSPSPRLWIISNNVLQPVIPFSASDLTKDSVLMYDGVFELFVIVGEDARGRRDEIRLAVAAAESVAAASAVTRSFPPPMHVLIFPTRVPVDLRANFRGMDKREAEGPSPPDHINLLTLEEARAQLDQQEWTLRQLKDPQFLPLAISPSMHPDFNSAM